MLQYHYGLKINFIIFLFKFHKYKYNYLLPLLESNILIFPSSWAEYIFDYIGLVWILLDQKNKNIME